MIDYCEYVISDTGSSSYRIAVPCFIGEGDELYVAAEMNRFYAAALAEMYKYATRGALANVRRRTYCCTFDVSVNGTDAVVVTLNLSERLVRGAGERTRTERKTVTHVWCSGVITGKSVG